MRAKTVEKKAVSVETEEITALIDRLGMARQAMKDVEKVEKEALNALKERGLDVGTYEGALYDLSVTERRDTPLNNAKVFKMVGKEKYIDITTVSKTKVRNYLSAEEIDRASEPATVTLVYATKKREE